MIENGFKQIVVDPCVYIKWFCKNFVLFQLYAKDMIILCKDTSIIGRLKELSQSFAMKDLGPAKKIFWM